MWGNIISPSMMNFLSRDILSSSVQDTDQLVANLNWIQPSAASNSYGRWLRREERYLLTGTRLSPGMDYKINQKYGGTYISLRGIDTSHPYPNNPPSLMPYSASSNNQTPSGDWNVWSVALYLQSSSHKSPTLSGLALGMVLSQGYLHIDERYYM